MPKKYIDADTLTLEIDDWRAELEATYGKNDEYVQCLKTVLGMIEDAPTADVVERKKRPMEILRRDVQLQCVQKRYIIGTREKRREKTMTVEDALYRISNVYTNLVQKDSQAAEPYRIAIIALNKQIGAKPYKIGNGRIMQTLCPQCNYLFYSSFTDAEKIAGSQSLYCERCGQRIDWEEEKPDE